MDNPFLDNNMADEENTLLNEATAAMDIQVNNNDDEEDDKKPAAAAAGGGGNDDPMAVDEDFKEDDDDDAVLSTSTTSTSDDDDEVDGGISPEKADRFLLEATNLKELGNNEFKNQQYEHATRSYRRGIQKLKKLNKNNTGDIQVQSLLVNLYTNFSTVSFKTQKYRVSVQMASEALQILDTNKKDNNVDENPTATNTTIVKALYRRAVADRKLGNLEQSRMDLKRALQLEPTNNSCKKELVQIRKELETSKKQQKQALAKAFSSSNNTKSLYHDKEAELQQRKLQQEEEEKRKKKEREEMLKKRKQQWEDECVSRMAKNEPAISFEEWEKVEDEKEKKRKEEEDKQRKEDEEAKKKKAKKSSTSSSATRKPTGDAIVVDDDSDHGLTEAELKMMRGYKKTADGRTTSYFTRELKDNERILEVAPQRLDVNNNNVGSDSRPAAAIPMMATSSSPTPLPSSTGTTKDVSSAWNQAGTWEEKDTTGWCKEQLTNRLQETRCGNEEFEVHVEKVTELTGDASVAVVSGKKRYIFDFHVACEYEVKQRKVVGTDDDNDEAKVTTKVVASGVVRLPDICSTHHDELEVNFDTWKKKPKLDVLNQVTEIRNRVLVQKLTENVQLFVQDFNGKY